MAAIFFDLGETLVMRRRELVPGAQGAVAELRRGRVRLGIISNTGDMTRRAVIKTPSPDFYLGAFEAAPASGPNPRGEIKPRADSYLMGESGGRLYHPEKPGLVRASPYRKRRRTTSRFKIIPATPPE